MMRARFPFIVLVALAAFAMLPSCSEPADDTPRIVIEADGHHEYETYDRKIHDWRRIMLPGTEIGMTTYVVGADGLEKQGESRSKRGHPAGLADLETGELEKLARRRIVQFMPMKDGNAIVSYQDTDFPGYGPCWTVWTQELLGRVLALQGVRPRLTPPISEAK
jgi:hypothetical protein